ncbi:sulfite oxidase [Ophiostoma piceae UAMH 11346]|uniref:Nitrate reductase [NADPH] n=1 Tax=Ophiostoma piceae (strain UAMH 11346) TaxID=1262450 RepID=S3C4S5_OPHP1|nr:sulfite oxidase [Ophiostoma piceae UAMH 11346]
MESKRQTSTEDHTEAPGPTRLTLYAGLSTCGDDINASRSKSPAPLTPTGPAPTAGDDRDPSLPRFRLADVRKHDANSGSPWVTSGDKVYDITDWVAAHPGGDVILQAAGHSIDPYWAIFTIHKAPHVLQVLESYCIGFVDKADLDDSGKPLAEGGIEDPFATDPKRDERLTVLTQKPCNAEPEAAYLAREFATPNELFYVRNHMWVPVVDVEEAPKHELTVELPDGEVRAYTLEELRTRFKIHHVPAVLQCSGNRRSDMTKSVGPTNGLQWGAGAISNAVWEGVLLKDVLRDAGLRTGDDVGATEDDPPSDSLHVQLTGMEAYAASIPLPVAMDARGDVLLAFGMNGKPLPRDHGYPLRAVVPGYVAARSVKWLSRIVVSDEESASQWQRRDYKLFGPNEGGKPNWDRYPAIQEMPITSAITSVLVGKDVKSCTDKSARAAAGVRDLKDWQDKNWVDSPKGTPVEVAGYAYSGGGREIVRVDVSVDGGRTWDQAELLDSPSRNYDDAEETQKKYVVARGRRDWAWKRWQYKGVLLDKSLDQSLQREQGHEILVKAVDSAYNTQPEHHDGIYNVRGNLATAWHRVRVQTNDDKITIQGCGFPDKPPRK